MKNVVLADWNKDDLSSFLGALEAASGKRFSLSVSNAEFGRGGPMRRGLRYLIYFLTPLRFFLFRRHYGIIVGWQQFYALIFCFYCSIFHVKKTNTVVAWNFTYKKKTGPAGALYHRFMRRCTCSGYLDWIHLPSERAAEEFSDTFGFPKEHIIACPFGLNDRYEQIRDLPAPEGEVKDGYILSIGRSNRDYDFLIRAWEGIDFPLVIVCDTYTEDPGDPNIRMVRTVTSNTQDPWFSNARAVVIPIQDASVCSGDTVLLTAMMLKKPVLVTGPSTLAETYIKDGENGLVVPKEPAAFRRAVRRVLQAEDAGLGERARRSFLDHFTRDRMGSSLGLALSGTI